MNEFLNRSKTTQKGLGGDSAKRMVHLNVSELVCGFGNRQVLNGVDFTAGSGEVFAILGANGTGKSTLLHAISGQIPIRSGSVSLDNANLTRLNAGERAKVISLMPQFESKETSLTVHEIVSLGRAPHRGWTKAWADDDLKIVCQAIERVGLTELKNRAVSTLSGGEWRRMMLARSLAQECPVMLLDEPTEGLDLRYQYECLEHVRTIVREQNIVALVTLHDLNLAAVFADRIGLMDQGRMVASGTPLEVLTKERIEAAFGLQVEVLQHPQLDTPLIVPVVSGT